MDDLIANLAKLLALVLAFLGVHRFATKTDREKAISHGLRLDALEKSKRDAIDCQRLQSACPVAVRLIAVEKQGDGLTDWLKRIEAKLDRLIEKD